MSVTTTDLKSMLSKVRRSDLSFPPTPPAATAAPTAAPVPVPVVAAPPPVPDAAEAVEEAENYDVDSILREIKADEELLLRILGMLYRAKKKSPNDGAIPIIPIEKQLGLARESATFVINYMKARKLIETNDKSSNMITVEGIEYLRAKLTK